MKRSSRIVVERRDWWLVGETLLVDDYVVKERTQSKRKDSV